MKAAASRRIDAYSEAELVALLAARYAAPAYALLAQVGNATGARHERWADALAMSLWPSRGLALMGFEVKSSRGDWLREKDDPRKAEAVARFCDMWWIVAGAEEIVRLDELPDPWGLLVPADTRGKPTLQVAKEAQRLEAKPIDRAFLAAVLRRAAESMVPAKSVEVAVKEQAIEHSRRWCQGHEAEIERLKDRIEEQRVRVEEFEQAAGFSIGTAGWTKPAAWGKAVRVLIDAESNGHMDLERRLTALRGMHLELGRAVSSAEEIVRTAKQQAQEPGV